ncbi:MAG: VOC family protein [Erythrobacter sp.]
MPVPNLPIRQLAYFVPDIEAAARDHSVAFGSGPFFSFNHVALASSQHRGSPHEWDHSSAYGQWGDVMVEFVAQHSDGPSAIRDIYPAGSGRFGFHHTAVFVKDLDEAIAAFAADGMPLAQLSETTTGTRFAFVDASETLGHMIELYEPSETLVGFYAMVRDAAQGWDGSDLIRPLN